MSFFDKWKIKWNRDGASLEVPIISQKIEEKEEEIARGLRFDDREVSLQFQARLRELQKRKAELERKQELNEEEEKEKRAIDIECAARFRVALYYDQYKLARLSLKLMPTGWAFDVKPGDELIPNFSQDIADQREQIRKDSPEFALLEDLTIGILTSPAKYITFEKLQTLRNFAVVARVVDPANEWIGNVVHYIGSVCEEAGNKVRKMGENAWSLIYDITDRK